MTAQESDRMSPVSLESGDEDIETLKARNRVLLNALKSISKSAEDHYKKSFELVWFANNRTRFPNHEVSKWLDHSEEHREDIRNLRSDDGDFHHGFNSGVLAATRMFMDHADLSHVNNFEKENADALIQAEQQHTTRVETSRAAFPKLDVEGFPEKRCLA
mmetsp:Transcript_28869/g.44374  ORF Transcript_28869/g.44374 Transcript_28869/m.44374 type:complete len:160 (+) Transcript_28869:1-480(+)